jgi:hypothetical protein
MTRVFVTGLGAVSPAGWGVETLRRALAAGTPLPCVPLAHPGWTTPLRTRPVPPGGLSAELARHPRLRRTSPLAQYVVAAGLEAWRGATSSSAPATGTVGLIVCLTAGCVNYTRRFFEEILQDPAHASPLLFPETVFNAPASHLAAVLGCTGESCTLVGDEGMFLQGLALAADWLGRGVAAAVLVIGADELDWLVGGAMSLFVPGAVHAAGAGAVCLQRDLPHHAAPAVELERVTAAWSYSPRQSPEAAARAMRRELPAGTAAEWLVLSTPNPRRFDAAERAAWGDWPGPRLTPPRVLGAAFNAGAAWQVVAACDALQRGLAPAATVSVVGTQQQAIGARFTIAPGNVSSGSPP